MDINAKWRWNCNFCYNYGNSLSGSVINNFRTWLLFLTRSRYFEILERNFVAPKLSDLRSSASFQLCYKLFTLSSFAWAFINPTLFNFVFASGRRKLKGQLFSANNIFVSTSLLTFYPFGVSLLYGNIQCSKLSKQMRGRKGERDLKRQHGRFVFSLSFIKQSRNVLIVPFV